MLFAEEIAACFCLPDGSVLRLPGQAAAQDLGNAMQSLRVWNNRQGLVRSCIGRHSHGDFHRMLKASGRADAAAKGQRFGDPWQMAADIVVGMARA